MMYIGMLRRAPTREGSTSGWLSGQRQFRPGADQWFLGSPEYGTDFNPAIPCRLMGFDGQVSVRGSARERRSDCQRAIRRARVSPSQPLPASRVGILGILGCDSTTANSVRYDEPEQDGQCTFWSFVYAYGDQDRERHGHVGSWPYNEAIDCGSTCTHTYKDQSREVTLIATADPVLR